jgi:hypothetical protein
MPTQAYFWFQGLVYLREQLVNRRSVKTKVLVLAKQQQKNLESDFSMSKNITLKSLD